MIRRLADEVRAHRSRDALGALAYDVLSRQAAGRALAAGREHVEERAVEHEVVRGEAQTSAGNLLAILERGPETDAERAMLAAFAVHGFGRELATAGGEDDDRVSRFVRHTDWLELATAYEVRAFVDALLEPEQAARVWRELAQAIVDEASGAPGASAAVRARNAARLTALAASTSEAARAALASVADTGGIDVATRALAGALRGGVPPSARIRGRIARGRRRGVRAVLAWVSGWALLSWLGRGLGTLLGIRREAELALGERGIEVREEKYVLGRKVAESVSTLALAAILEAGREVRYPSLHLLVGAVALSIGLLAGGLFVFDGVRSGELSVLLVGAALAFVGAGLDLALDVVAPGRKGRVCVDLVVHRGRLLRVAGVPLAEADRFLGALSRRAGP